MVVYPEQSFVLELEASELIFSDEDLDLLTLTYEED